MKDMSEAKVILGIKIIMMGDSIMLSQEYYIEKIFKRFRHFDVKPVSTPYDANTHLMKIMMILWVNFSVCRLLRV